VKANVIALLHSVIVFVLAELPRNEFVYGQKCVRNAIQLALLKTANEISCMSGRSKPAESSIIESLHMSGKRKFAEASTISANRIPK
jgi:hypothetical protein